MKLLLRESAKKNHMLLAMAITATICALSFIGAFVLRFDLGNIPEKHRLPLMIGLPVMVIIRMVVLAVFKVHRGLYRYVSLHDLVQLFKAVSMGTVLFAGFWLLTFNWRYFMPRSIYFIDWMLCLMSLGGLRACVRLWRNRRERKSKVAATASGGRALIVGAGNMGENILRIIDRRFLGQEIDVVGFADNDPMKQGTEIHGIPVLGRLDDIPHLVQENHVKTVVFAISFPPAGLFQKVVSSCDGLAVRFNTVSVLKDMTTGELSVDKMRSLRIEDLLGRSPVQVDSAPVSRAVSNQTVMVTGAGGSIGSELSRQLASFKPKRLILLDSGETPLFEIDRELRQIHPSLNIQAVIADIKHGDVIERIFKEEEPDFVYHAAAYKHVPLMEDHPDEAVLNNIRGTRNLAQAARRHKCKRFVMISSDKAVRPSNVMGATKRMCELVVQSLNGSDTIFTAVRFGNVLGSNGSVIPIFKKQLEAGGPLTVTHPDMTRYFMTIPEAVSLVLQCGVIAEAGDIFVLDMGTPVKIIDLAKNIIRLSGLREDIDISIKVTGLRPGEKMYEELVAYGEELKPAGIAKVNVLKQKSNGLCHHVLMAMMGHMEDVAMTRNAEKTRALLWRMIELDHDRARFGKEGLMRRDVASLVGEWVDTVDIPGRPPEPAKGRILAVVGSLEIKDVLEGIIHTAGYELDCFASSEQALHLLASDRGYTALLCDYIMPFDTAWKLRDKVRNLDAKIPVVAMSMYDSQLLSQVLEIEPELPVLRKPFDGSAFEDMLHATLNPIRGSGAVEKVV